MKETSSQDTVWMHTNLAAMHAEKKKNRKVVYPYTLKTALADYTRDELKEIGDSLHIEIKSADKKQERIDKIYAGITKNNRIERCLLCMYEEEWNLLKDLVSYEKACPLNTDTPLPALAVSQYLGYDEEGYIIIPQEIKEGFQAAQRDEFLQRRKKMQWLQQCLAMAKNLYGAMPFYILVELYNQHKTIQSNALEIGSMMQLIPQEMQTYFLQDDLVCDILMTKENVESLLHDRVLDVYYIPSLREIENEATGNILYFNPHMVKQGMTKLYKYTSLSKNQTLDVMGDIIDEMASGWSPDDIIEDLSIKQIIVRKGEKKRLQELFAEWNYYTKKWVNCGYSDEEIKRFNIH